MSVFIYIWSAVEKLLDRFPPNVQQTHKLGNYRWLKMNPFLGQKECFFLDGFNDLNKICIRNSLYDSLQSGLTASH